MKSKTTKLHALEMRLLIVANILVWATVGYLVFKKIHYGGLFAKNDRTRVIISAEDDSKSFVVNIDNGHIRGMTDFETEMPVAKKSVLRIYQSIDETQLVHTCAFEPQRSDGGVYSLHISERNGQVKVSNCRLMKTH